VERRRLKQERLQRHKAKLAEIAEARRENLLTAARQWIESENLRSFIARCELRWREAASGQLSPDQTDWLNWARSEMASLDPFAKGFPDPSIDGRFDPSSVPLGGPYPETKNLDEQKPMEPPPAPPQVKTVYVERPQPPEPFPFWLLHPKH